MGQAKRGKAYAEYYADDLGKNIKSSEIVFSKKHSHGAKPSDREIASLIDDLVVAVMRVFEKANKPCPDDAVIREHAVIETYSEQ